MGNPQNMLIGQLGRLHFGRFFLWCAPPSILALGAAYLIIRTIYRRDLNGTAAPVAGPEDAWPAFDRHQSMKGTVAAFILLTLFFTPVPREISAICIAGILLCSRSMHTRSLLGLVDWHLITLFCALFIVIKGFETAGAPAAIIASLHAHGVDIRHLFVLTAASAGLSNLVSNVPATMLLTRFLDHANPVQWYVLALSSTFAGNLITIGSIANIITFEQAKEYGVEIGFREHAKVGIPVTLASLAVAAGWIALIS
jgi:Na+/H+ antiporter NhaD/arsenite permease-like protein